jgi:hypothetical protein
MAAADDMRALVDQLYGTFASGDSTVWSASAADDVIGIGSDLDEWWEGRNVVTSIVTAQVQETREAGIRLVADDPRIVEHGTVRLSGRSTAPCCTSGTALRFRCA